MKHLRHEHPWLKVLIAFFMISCMIIFGIIMFHITKSYRDEAPYDWDLSNAPKHQRFTAPAHTLSGATTTGAIKANKEAIKK